jgi:hypothetical protein
MRDTKYKTITITVELSEFAYAHRHEIDELTTRLIRETSRKINRTIKSHNRFKDYKINADSITIKTFPNNI